jgi:hypothetical protein
MAFRSVPRPSSPPDAKASTECPYRAPTHDNAQKRRRPPCTGTIHTRSGSIPTQHRTSHTRQTHTDRTHDHSCLAQRALNATAAVDGFSKSVTSRLPQSDRADRSTPRCAPEPIHHDKEQTHGQSPLPPGRQKRRSQASLRRHEQSTVHPTALTQTPDQTDHGGGGRDRTDDPLLAKQVLSQLSYTPIRSARHTRFGGDPRPIFCAPVLTAIRPLRSGARTSNVAAADAALTRQTKSVEQTDSEPWWAREDLNLRPHAYQACALTN